MRMRVRSLVLLSGLRIQRCCGCDSYSSDSVPSPGTSICHECSPESTHTHTQKEREINKENSMKERVRKEFWSVCRGIDRHIFKLFFKIIMNKWKQPMCPVIWDWLIISGAFIRWTIMQPLKIMCIRQTHTLPHKKDLHARIIIKKRRLWKSLHTTITF